MTDSTDSLANKGYVLTIENVRDNTEGPVSFKAFLTDLNDSFESSWNETQVYARMDPIWTFQNTKRTISVGFTIPAYGPAEAQATQEKLSKLARFLYPTYNISQGVATMSGSPLFRVKYVNLIQNAADGRGLLGVIQGFSFKPNLEMGFFPKEQKPLNGPTSDGLWANTFGVIEEIIADEGNLLFAKEYELTFDLNVLHEHKLGYSDQTRQFRGVQTNFPYRANKGTTAGTPTEEMSEEDIAAAQESLIMEPGGGDENANSWRGDAFTGPDAAPWDGENAQQFFDPSSPFGDNDGGF